MSRKRKTQPTQSASPENDRPAPEPVSVVDGIPDRAAKPTRWRYVSIGAIFLAWVAFLVYCALAGKP